MGLSIFTTVTTPQTRGDTWKEAFDCYRELADELVVVDGSPELSGGLVTRTMQFVVSPWPNEFDWPLIGEQFQRGYEAAREDWVIHADLDYIFHEREFDRIKQVLNNHADKPAVSFYKWQFIQPDRYNLKSRLVIAVNKGKYGDRIRFDSGGDLCQPSLDGNYLDPGDVAESGIAFWNYEKPTKTREQISDDVGRMDRAYYRHFGKYMYGKGDNESAFDGWLEMVKARYAKPYRKVALSDHPRYMQETIKNLNNDQFGKGGFGCLG